VLGKLIELGFAESWQVGAEESAGTVSGSPFTTMFWTADSSSASTDFTTPGNGSIPPNAAAPTMMVTVDAPEAGMKVCGAVQVSGDGVPAPPVHGPVDVARRHVDATCPKRSVMDPVATISLPSYPSTRYQAGDVGGDVVLTTAGTVSGPPFMVMFWTTDSSSTSTVLTTPGTGSTPPNAAAPTTMVTVDAPGAGVKVCGAVQVSGVGVPAPPVHGPLDVAIRHVDATCPKRSVMGPVATIVLPSYAPMRYHVGEVVWPQPTEGIAEYNAIMLTAQNARMTTPF
jgi:hypothetical protein